MSGVPDYVIEFILGGSLTVSVMAAITLYGHREDLARENARLTLELEIERNK